MSSDEIERYTTAAWRILLGESDLLRERLENEIAALSAEIDSLQAEIERLRAPSWVEYIEITRNWLAKYPPDVFTGESGESGPLFVVSVRQALAELDATQEQSE